MYFDDDTEYLKRYYTEDESRSKVVNITPFYSTVEGNIRLNYPHHDQFPIIQKCKEQHNNLFLAKFHPIQSQVEIPQPQSQPQREVNPNPSVEPINIVDKEKKPSTDVEDNKVALKSEITSEKPQTSNKNQEQIETKKETENKEVLPKENKFLLQEAWDLDYSFESLRHDIYYPEFSKEELLKD